MNIVKNNFIWVFIFYIGFVLVSCSSKRISLDNIELNTVIFNDLIPESVTVDDILASDQIMREWGIHLNVLKGFRCEKTAKLTYAGHNDSVEIEILEFALPELAYGFMLHTGLGHDKTNWRLGKREVKHYQISNFVFRIKAYQPKSFKHQNIEMFLNNFVEINNDADVMSPQIYEAFPRKYRLKKQRSLQISGFMGSENIGAVVSQAYQDSLGRYVLARSLNDISEKQFSEFISEFSYFENIKLEEVEGMIIANDNDMFYCMWNNQKLSFIYGSFNRKRLMILVNKLKKQDFLAK